jgi:endonuclease III
VAVAARTISCTKPVDLRLTLRVLPSGGGLTTRFAADGVWRATRTPEGPATLHLSGGGERVEAEAWGPGAAWAVEQAPALIGAEDREDGFESRHPVVAEVRRRLRGLRVGRSHAVVESLVPTVLEQKVQGIQARRSYARLVRALGEPAPGPVPLLIPPEPARIAALPYYVFHQFNVERRRAETVRLVARHARRLEEATAMSPADATRRLRALPGVGAWTAAEVSLVALGDPDAVSVGDYHIKDLVVHYFTGRARGSDEEMLDLLAQWPGQRQRVVRLVELSGVGKPRFGPRLAPVDIRAI